MKDISRYMYGDRDEKAVKAMAEVHAAWRAAYPEKVKAVNAETNRKGGKYYDHKLEYNRTGLQHLRQLVRGLHNRIYAKYKHIIAPLSQIHHEWVPGTAKYAAVALVEAKPHQYGLIKPLIVLEGKITLMTEKEIKEQ